ncbi:GNAT family N-acetyltransferase [Azospirillum canadense]|uniref:GNAT family N-acetyltransferase n=1 Tax=Azospirillum canadense TaxID=403962 RepID=UPI0022266421|nr:GNAT family N-acetyltransferase [Azospirillum canadense]MCW2243936.1 CelD/BcsL family acetyltransferase involved in cellulose biosynthesis [Azospirillum canadense]
MRQLWTDLESRADGSFFLSWSWIGNWLAFLPAKARPHLLKATSHGRVVGLALLCPRTLWRFGLLRTRCWLLHETGERVFDRLFMEYNGILADRSCAPEVLTACFDWLGSRLTNWDELVLGGLEPAAEAAVRRVAQGQGHTLQVRVADSTQWVDLGHVRQRGGDYLATLGKNTRATVRRAMRLYTDRGPLDYRVAANADEALADFRAMEVLHQSSWAARGQSGAFSNPSFRPFHERLIATGVPEGTVRMCRVSVAGQPVGFLYNFVHRGRVMNYQGGFAYEEDKRVKPGLVSHVLAVEDTLARGEDCYDFMSTPAGHKPLLSNAEQPMNWLALGPDRVSRQIDARLRQAKCGLIERLKRLPRSPLAPMNR